MENIAKSNRLCWYGMGDLWAYLSHLILTKSQEEISKYVGRNGRLVDKKDEILQILNCFDEKSKIKISEDEGRNEVTFSVKNHKEPYCKTKVQWNNPKSKIISYQIYTMSTHNPERKMNQDEVNNFFFHMNKKGYECINLNNRSLSLLEICNILAMSKAFIGIDSGISHIAHSVGVPSCLYFYNKLATSHPNKKYIPFRNINELKNYV